MAVLHRKLFSSPVTDIYDDQLYPPPSPPPLQFDVSKHSQISTLWIIFFCFVGGSLLLFCYYMILRKYRMNPNNLDRNLHDLQNTHEDLLDEDHGPVVNHPIWLINTVGLQEAIIESIAVFKYKKNEALVEGTECSVCLNEFQEDESLRLLPKCSHAFHIPCIDTWLRSHKNCPLCRAPVVRENASVNFSEPASNHVEETEQESVENRVEESGESNIGVEEVVERNFRNLDKRVLSDLVNYNVKLNAGFQHIRRSISMDCSSANEGSSNTRMVKAKKPNLQAAVKKSDSNLSLHIVMKSCSFGGSLRKGQVKMKRSFSSADKRHKNRYSKSHDSILPH